MKGRLVGIAKARRVFHPYERNASVLGDRSSHLAGCLSLRVKLVIAVLSAHGEGWKENSIKPPEIARNRTLFADRLDPIDRADLAFVEASALLLASQLDHLADGIIADRREMGRRSRGDPSGDAKSIEEDDRSTFS